MLVAPRGPIAPPTMKSLIYKALLLEKWMISGLAWCMTQEPILGLCCPGGVTMLDLPGAGRNPQTLHC